MAEIMSRNNRSSTNFKQIHPSNSPIKELNLRWRVYAEIPKPSRVELKCSQEGLGIST
jgi:hypothetical protein